MDETKEDLIRQIVAEKFAHRLRRYRRESSALVKAAREAGCELCDEKESCCIDFHHRDKDQKLFNLSQRRGRPPDEVEAELAKCVPLCKNCHAKLHAGILELASLDN